MSEDCVQHHGTVAGGACAKCGDPLYRDYLTRYGRMLCDKCVLDECRNSRGGMKNAFVWRLAAILSVLIVFYALGYFNILEPLAGKTVELEFADGRIIEVDVRLGEMRERYSGKTKKYGAKERSIWAT